MKQGGKSIIGLWKWNADAIFEKGDFVIKGENIYRVNSKTIEGIDPDIDLGNGAYELYPGNRIDTKEEYEEIINNSESAKDLYVSSSALNSILKDVYFGLDSNGIINGTIDVSPENVISTSADISLSPSNDVLDQLIEADGYNNGTIKVSKNLPSIKTLVGHPDETELVSRNGRSWVVCDRDLESPTRCRKCWECVRACENKRIKKTVDNNLVINNGDPDNMVPLSDDEAKGFEKAVNICPYHSLSYTSSSTAAIEESISYKEASNGSTSKIPTNDLIVFGAKTFRRRSQNTQPGEYVWVKTGTSESNNLMVGIAIPSQMFENSDDPTYVDAIRVHIEDVLRRFNLRTGHSGDTALFDAFWVSDVAEDVPNGVLSQETTENNGVRQETKISASYSPSVSSAKSICVLEAIGSETARENLVSAIEYMINDINNSYTQIGTYEFNWKHYISHDNSPYLSAALPGEIKAISGNMTITRTTYQWQQQASTTTDVFWTVSYSQYLCAILDALNYIGEAVGGDDYNKCRITQSLISSTDNTNGSWDITKTKRYPSKWTSTLYPDANKSWLSDYPIATYWDYWGDPDIEDHDEQKNFYTQWRNGDDELMVSYYNLTGNIFCVKIPEEAIQYLNFGDSSLSDYQKEEVQSRAHGIISRVPLTVWPSEALDSIESFLNSGGIHSLSELQSLISMVGYCDSVFNVTFGRYGNNNYITGTSRFIENVENKISQSKYYYRLDKMEAALGSEDEFDEYTINTNLEEWRVFASNNISDHHIHFDDNGYTVDGNEGPGFALLPRVMYSEWTDLVLSANLESDEEDGSNNSNLLLVPRWMSEQDYTPVSSSICYTEADDRTPFWIELVENGEISNSGSGIDPNIKYIEGYFDRNFFVSGADSYAILKQYSYYGSSGELQRVQELVDPQYGEMFIRSTRNLDWKPCVVNDKNTIRKMTRLLSTLDTFRQRTSNPTQITNSTYGTSSLNTWQKDIGWELDEAINGRHYYVRDNVSAGVFILLVKAGNKYYNITIHTSRSSVDTTYNITQDISISVKYSINLNKVFVICSYGVDLEDIYYGK